MNKKSKDDKKDQDYNECTCRIVMQGKTEIVYVCANCKKKS